MSQTEIIFTVNPGSTSTKMACFRGEHEQAQETFFHDVETLSSYKNIWEQFGFRLRLARDWCNRIKEKPAAVVGIGGLLKPVSQGTYRINDMMLNDARANLQGAHPSNLGCAMAFELAQVFACPSFVVDPVSVDELEPLARYSGHPLIERKSLSHALNIHAMARRAARDIGKRFDDASFVIVHLGGGISIAPVTKGRIIDVNDASSDGPFSPERTGGLPLQQFIGICYSGKLAEKEVRAMVMGKGGLSAYLGTSSLRKVEQRIDAGDSTAKEVFDAMSYQVAKEIGAMTTVLYCDIDAIVLTGGMASSARLVGAISGRIQRLARILVYPGEDEMLALAQGALRVLRGQEKAKEY